jgi:hypothetical protein
MIIANVKMASHAEKVPMFASYLAGAADTRQEVGELPLQP